MIYFSNVDFLSNHYGNSRASYSFICTFCFNFFFRIATLVRIMRFHTFLLCMLVARSLAILMEQFWCCSGGVN